MGSQKKVRVGVLGCGVISKVYFERLATFDTMEVVACADIDVERAKATGIPKASAPEELLADPDVDLIVNLTVPAVHAELSQAALEAGKSVYTEKPIALTRDDAAGLVAKAASSGLALGSAPDTFLGAGHQTCRKLIDDGVIGEVVSALAVRIGPGPEWWHPNPAFFYHRGAGPLFDVGVYDVTAVVALLGPVRRVSGAARITHRQRPIRSKPLKGTMIDVEVPTHVAATLDMASGPVVSLVSSFDAATLRRPGIEVYGTEGTLVVPDPNTFGGPVRLKRAGATEWEEVPMRHAFAEQARGIGVADMVLAARNGRPARAGGQFALHVIDVMQSVIESSEAGASVQPTTTCERPAALPEDWDGTSTSP